MACLSEQTGDRCGQWEKCVTKGIHASKTTAVDKKLLILSFAQIWAREKFLFLGLNHENLVNSPVRLQGIVKPASQSVSKREISTHTRAFPRVLPL